MSILNQQVETIVWGRLPNLKEVIDACEPCVEVKGKSISYKSIEKIKSNRPYTKTFIHRHKYFLTIIDDCSHNIFAFPLKSKSVVFGIFQRFTKRAEWFLNRTIKFIHTDNAFEFINDKFKTFCGEHGIQNKKKPTPVAICRNAFQKG